MHGFQSMYLVCVRWWIFKKVYLNAVFKVYICTDEKRSNNSDNLQFRYFDILNVWNIDLIFMLNNVRFLQQKRHRITLLQRHYITKIILRFHNPSIDSVHSYCSCTHYFALNANIKIYILLHYTSKSQGGNIWHFLR